MTDFLAIVWNADPVLFSIFGLQVRWYSLMFVAGFGLGWFIFQWFCKNEKLNPRILDSLLITLIVGTIVGARLGHCLFYQPDYYLGSWKGFLEIFMPWEGGLASHGGTIALFFAMIWFARKYGRNNNFDFVWLLDHLAVAVGFAACFIRLGNLFNSEIYGGPTNLPWGFIFVRNEETEPHHPPQLYEALSYLLLGLFLLWLYKRDVSTSLDMTANRDQTANCHFDQAKRAEKSHLYRGTLIGIFFIWCFGSRFLIEFIKNDQVDFEAGMALNMGQLLSIPFVLLGIGFLVYANKKKLPLLTDGGFKETTKKTSK